MKRVLIIRTSDLSRAPRVLKQIQALKNSYIIDTIGTKKPEVEGVAFYCFNDYQVYDFKYKLKLVNRLIFHQYSEILNDQSGMWRVDRVEEIEKPDLIIAHDPDGLFLTNQLKEHSKWQCPVIYDAHEYEPRQYGSLKYQWINRPNLWYLKRSTTKIDAYFTVGPIIAGMYENYLGLEKESVEVTYNATFYKDSLSPSKTGETIKLVVHGIASPDRKLELMIETMKLLPPDKFTLDMYLVETDTSYYSRLKKIAQTIENVKICKPVPYAEIVSMLNKYDVFFYSIFPSSYSLRYCLPNKFFEAVQGRLAVVIGPSPEMKVLVDKYDLGVCAEGFTSQELSKAIKRLTPEKVDYYKKNADEAAHELSAEMVIDKIKRIVDRMIEKDKNTSKG